jgi:hypothetical protein
MSLTASAMHTADVLQITWFPSDNGGLTMVPWLATCTKLHSLTLEFDMSSFSRQRSVWTTPVHGLRKVSQ